MEMKLIDVLFGIVMLVFGGILKHIYGKFEKLDKVDEGLGKSTNQNKEDIAVLKTNIAGINKDFADLKDAFKDLADSNKELSVKITDLLVEIKTRGN